MKQDLTPFILAYKNGTLPREIVVKKVSLYGYGFLQKRYKNEEDTASEIFCRLYRKIPRMIEIFEYRGKPFEIYLHVSIKRIAFTFFQQRSRNEALKQYSEEAYCEDRLFTPAENDSSLRSVTTGENQVSTFVLDAESRIATDHLRRRVLCLACKNAFHITLQQIERTARLTGVESAWLEERIRALREGMTRRIERFSHLTDQRREYMARARLYHDGRASAVAEDERNRYERRYNEASRRMRKISAALQRIPLSPTHTQIARELGIPKGSVDSGLHYLKNSLQDPSS